MIAVDEVSLEMMEPSGSSIQKETKDLSMVDMRSGCMVQLGAPVMTVLSRMG